MFFKNSIKDTIEGEIQYDSSLVGTLPLINFFNLESADS